MTQGIKILILVFGFWMYTKQVKPLLEKAEEKDNSMSRIL